MSGFLCTLKPKLQSSKFIELDVQEDFFSQIQSHILIEGAQLCVINWVLSKGQEFDHAANGRIV